MKIKLAIENIEDLKNFSDESSVICLKSISSWIVDYYFKKIYLNESKPSYIIGFYDMFQIYQLIQSSSYTEFINFCKNKLKENPNDLIIKKYTKYLNSWGLIDIIDLFHQCKLDTFIDTFILSIKNINNEIDKLFFEYLLELPSSSTWIYDVNTKQMITETKENLIKLINHDNIISTPTNIKNSIKHDLCSYLSLLLNTQNEYAFLHCLKRFLCTDIPREIIAELEHLIKFSKNESLTVYQVLLSFVRRKELISNGILLPSEKYDELFDKYFSNFKEFFQFIEQLHMIIEENEEFNNEILCQLLKLILKQIDKNISELLINEIIEEFCQDYHKIESLSFHQSIAYLFTKQTIDLPVFIHSSSIELEPVEDKTVNLSMCDENQHILNRCLDLSTIHEISFESDSIIDHPLTCENKKPIQPIVKRQPLREIDINTFNDEGRQIENEKIYHQQKSIVLTLVSDGDKENLPVITKKRSIMSTNIEPPCKKQKKTNVKSSDVEQKIFLE